MEPTRPHILVVDDESFIREALELYFESHGFLVSAAEDGTAALEIFLAPPSPIDVVILDLLMPGTHGLDVLKKFKSLNAGVEVIIATGCGTMNHAVEALRYGAFDFITKPILNFEEDLLQTVHKALNARTSALSTTVAARFREGENDTTESKTGASEARGAPTPERRPEMRQARPSSRSWTRVYSQLNDLSAKHGHRPVDEKTLDDVWLLLHEGLGADAAVFLREQGGFPTDCLQSWGFGTAPTARDIWASTAAATDPAPAAAASHPDSVAVPRAEQLKWSRVLHIPFSTDGLPPAGSAESAAPGGDSPQRVVLLLFYRGDSELDLEDSPLPLLAAVLSWVFRYPNPVTAPHAVTVPTSD